MSCVTLVKAALARFLFGVHILVTVWRVVSQEEDAYWKLAIGEGSPINRWLENFIM